MAALAERIRRTKMFQWAAAYLAGAWLVLQLLDVLSGQFEWPRIVFRIALVLLTTGLPAALVLAWYHGEKGTQRVSGAELAMIGGILVDLDSITIRQVPGLGNLPVIGNLFKNTSTIKSTGELIFFITPRIKPLDAISVLAPGEEPPAPAAPPQR